jgi:hypothetical protein
LLRTGNVDNDADVLLQLPTGKDIRMHTKGLVKTTLGLALGGGLTVAAWAAPAVVEKGSYEVYGEGVIDELECTGEPVLEKASIVVNYHRVQTPKGDYVYHDLWLDATGTLTGLESETVWTLKKFVSPGIDRSTGGGMVEFNTSKTYVSETGQRITLRAVYHVSFDANGELRVDHFEWGCAPLGD